VIFCARLTNRVMIGALLSYAAVFSNSRVVRLPLDCGHFDQSGNGAVGPQAAIFVSLLDV
jgi:hypothetical protein